MGLNTSNIGELLITAFLNKYRYSGSSKGDLTTEDIFHIKKEQLNDIANDIDSKINNGKKDFIGDRSTNDIENENKLEIVKYAISLIKERENQSDINKKIREDLRKLEAAMKIKEDNSIMEMSNEELQKRYNELRSQLQ